jgi:hypothetical protein
MGRVMMTLCLPWALKLAHRLVFDADIDALMCDTLLVPFYDTAPGLSNDVAPFLTPNFMRVINALESASKIIVICGRRMMLCIGLLR